MDAEEFITIDGALADSVLSFIIPRPGVPPEVEDVIVQKQKNYYAKKLLNKTIKRSKLDQLKNIIEKNYYNSLMQPGETVGIICGQSIGEKTTQSSLNNFHTAGLDTGSTSQIDSLQNVINASKIKKKELRKYFKVSLFLNDRPKSLIELKSKTTQFLEEVRIKHLMLLTECKYKDLDIRIPEIFEKESVHFNNSETVLEFKLSLEKIFIYRITRKQILKAFRCEHKFCVPFSMLDETSTTLSVYCDYGCENIFEFFFKVKEYPVVGIEGVESHIFSQHVDTGEWYVDCLCNSINCFFKYYHVYDLTRIFCNSVSDIYNCFGILVAQELIIEKCKEIIPEIDDCHFKILAMRMTKNGSIEPLTRYSMRNGNSPLSKASFEESFETFIKACKYKEKEKFKSISSSIICGKKPNVGTYQCDVLIDPEFYF